MIIIETCPKCGHDLTDSVICTNPPIPKKECHNCGWIWEGQREQTVRVPFNKENIFTLQSEYDKFIKTENGKQWVIECVNRNNGQTGTCGDYIYDFYPEVLM